MKSQKWGGPGLLGAVAPLENKVVDFPVHTMMMYMTCGGIRVPRNFFSGEGGLRQEFFFGGIQKFS
jgi:hypothetical protein